MRIYSLLLGVALTGALASPLKEIRDVVEVTEIVTIVDTIFVTPTIINTVDVVVETQDNVVYVTAPPVLVTVTESTSVSGFLGTVAASSLVQTDIGKKQGMPGMPFHLPALPPGQLSYDPVGPFDPGSTIVVASAVSVASSTGAASTSQAELSQTQQALPTATILYSLEPTDPIYAALVAYSHNVHRANHTNTGPLEYNSTLAQYAKEKALSCIWDESVPSDANYVGMNMAEGTYIGAANVTGTIEDMWYNGEINLFPGYNEPNPDMSNFQNWGHFTQVVWRATTSVGCWSSPCDRQDGAAHQIGSGFFTVCMYFPPGNIGGEYGDQVGIPLDRATIHGV